MILILGQSPMQGYMLGTWRPPAIPVLTSQLCGPWSSHLPTWLNCIPICWIEWGELLEAPWIQSTVNSQSTFTPCLQCDNECSLLPALGYQVQTVKGETSITWFFRLLPSLTLTVFQRSLPKNWTSATVKRAREQESGFKRTYTTRLLSRRKMEKNKNEVVAREGQEPVCEAERSKSFPLSSSLPELSPVGTDSGAGERCLGKTVNRVPSPSGHVLTWLDPDPARSRLIL